MELLANRAPEPCGGSYADGFAPVVDRFASHLRDGIEIGAGLAVYHRGRRVVDVWGGAADVASGSPWRKKPAFAMKLHVTAPCAP